MAAVAEALPGAVLMDTCAAGVRGALLDPQARDHLDHGLTVVNVGNAHTFAALVRGDRLWGIYEHHTGLLNPEKLFDHLERFQQGALTNDEVFDDQGHGCAYAPDFTARGEFAFTVITGPRRRLARGWPGVDGGALRRHDAVRLFRPGGGLLGTGKLSGESGRLLRGYHPRGRLP